MEPHSRGRIGKVHYQREHVSVTFGLGPLVVLLDTNRIDVVRNAVDPAARDDAAVLAEIGAKVVNESRTP